MKIAIIPTAYRTIFFHAVAGLLELEGHEVFWLSPNRRWARWLLGRGVLEGRVLDVSRFGGEWAGEGPASTEDLDRLVALEQAGNLTIHNIILMDPLLIRRPRERSLKYLATCARLVREFLEANQIQAVFGEQTWAFELLVGQVCRSLDVPHLVPHTVRIPDPRFAFFDGHLETDIVRVREPAAQDCDEASAYLADFRRRQPRPGYMRIDRRVMRPRWDRLRTLARHVIDLQSDPFDETSLRPAGLILEHSRQAIRGALNRRSRRLSVPELPAARPFVFFPLHKQPEASIDIKGNPFCNQVELIRALARTLPVSHDLYVKENPIASNTRSAWVYEALERIPGVRLIGPRVDSFRLITLADLVVTVTGTAGYEAALLGRPAATIAPVFFDRIVAQERFDPFHDSLARLLLSPDRPRPKPEADLVEFLAWIIAQSFPGVVGDAFWQPESLEPANLSQVARGFLRILEILATRQGPGIRGP